MKLNDLILTSMVQLLFSLALFPNNNGMPSMNRGLFPSFEIKKSPLLRNLIVPCLRDTLCAGPSNAKFTSTSSCSDFLPSVILTKSNQKKYN